MKIIGRWWNRWWRENINVSVVVRNVERFIRMVFRIYVINSVTLTDNCEKVIAKKTLLDWKIKESD